MADQDRDNEIYSSGVHDGQQADSFDQFAHNLTKGYTLNERENEIYNSGYDYGVEHQSDSNNGSSGSGSSGNDGGCFLSTACVVAHGLPDDCHELTTLRLFRDNYVSRCAGGKDLISKYYAEAPGLLRRLEARPEGGQILKGLFATLVAPAVALVESGDFQGALDLYHRSVLELREIVGLEQGRP